MLPEGETTVVFGPNGAGKTTLLRALAGIGFDGLLADPVYMQQRPYLFRGSAGYNLGLGLDAEGAAWACQIADQFGIGDLLEQRTSTLSGGQRQRLVLARTLAMPGRWTLLDEPLTGIDRVDRDGLLAAMTRLLEKRNAVVVSHDIDIVAALADHLVVMEHGRVLEQGRAGSVIGSPASVRTAEVLGTANLISGLAREAGEMCLLQHGAISILGLGNVRGPGRALFGAETVTLRPATMETSSARNSWLGTVESILHRGQLVEVAVDVGVRIVAVVTPGAMVDLAVKPGDEVGISVKASAVRIVAA